MSLLSNPLRNTLTLASSPERGVPPTLASRLQRSRLTLGAAALTVALAMGVRLVATALSPLTGAPDLITLGTLIHFDAPGIANNIVLLPVAIVAATLLFVSFPSDISAKDSIALGIFVGGGAANVFEGVATGAVLDYIYLPNPGVVANIADVAIAMGALLLFHSYVFVAPNEKPA